MWPDIARPHSRAEPAAWLDVADARSRVKSLKCPGGARRNVDDSGYLAGRWRFIAGLYRRAGSLTCSDGPSPDIVGSRSRAEPLGCSSPAWADVARPHSRAEPAAWLDVADARSRVKSLKCPGEAPELGLLGLTLWSVLAPEQAFGVFWRSVAWCSRFMLPGWGLDKFWRSMAC